MIAVVVPTCRPQQLADFVAAWKETFSIHACQVVIVHDGDNPYVQARKVCEPDEIMGHDTDLIYNHNDGVRNLGFAYVARFLPNADIIITLDDDTKPDGDTITRHYGALMGRKCVSWVSTADDYMRGFPYGVRGEAEVVLSHGVWEGVPDYDAPTQLVNGIDQPIYYQGVIPKGAYYPMCGMNLAFKRKLLPWMYFAPMGPSVGLDRFADIWCGITSKRVIDAKGWAVVTGYASVIHERASNVWDNLQKEALGLRLNEGFWKGEEDHEYFQLYARQRERWQEWMETHGVNIA